jgi:hypothetical protein
MNTRQAAMEGLLDSVVVKQKKLEDVIENMQSKLSNLRQPSKENVEKPQGSDENDRKRLKERLKEVMLASNAASNHTADLIKVYYRFGMFILRLDSD